MLPIHDPSVTVLNNEVIELHATFLETNLQAQIRALPNPSFNGQSTLASQGGHPLTLHLSPTSTANIVVSSIEPLVDAAVPFVKLAPDAEVIVAPKLQSRASRPNRAENRSIASTSQRSVGAKSDIGSGRLRNRRDESKGVFLRGLDKHLFDQWGRDGETNDNSHGLKVWLDPDFTLSGVFRGLDWVCVSIVQPTGIQHPPDPQELHKLRDLENGESKKHASKVVAELELWNGAPDSRHVLLSPALCTALGVEGIVGGVVRIEPAPTPLPRGSIKGLRFYPFMATGPQRPEGLKLRGDVNPLKDTAIQRIRSLYGTKNGNCVLAGPLTDGLILRTADCRGKTHHGGMLRLKPYSAFGEDEKTTTRWLVDQNATLSIEVSQEIPDPLDLLKATALDSELLPAEPSHLMGIEKLSEKLVSNLFRRSSLLLNGGLGSGKTSLVLLLGYRLRQEHLFNVTYFNCHKLMVDEVRSSAVKEVMERIFTKASWGARLGSKSIVILDDLDKLCPAETELQVGGENGRSRQISELFCSIVRRYCYPGSKIVLLATSQGKDALNSVIIGGHIISDVVDLKAPKKDQRREILRSLIQEKNQINHLEETVEPDSLQRNETLNGSQIETTDAEISATNSDDLDALKIVGQTDGYMPGDLVLLVSRAQGEGLIRTAKDHSAGTNFCLLYEDFQQALKGFKPASLRHVTLQSSSTKFDSIGGLKETRKTLLETLQYPTLYAPIFAQCPLRLRSGLLLYGYPGCGKTLLASAVAGECGLNFISVKGPEILNKYIGASEKSVRDLFERAEAARPCVLFFDEFDSIAPKRGHDSTGVTDRVVNQLLTQMDGAEGLSGVYVLAATSRPDLIDPALLRPGRLDKSLLCSMPSAEDRLDILLTLSRALKIDQDILTSDEEAGRNLANIVNRTEGYSGADLQALMYNAHLEAIHDVLGDRKHVMQGANGRRQPNKPTQRDSQGTNDFMNFPFGEKVEFYKANDRVLIGNSHFKWHVDNAIFEAKLEAIKVAKHKKRAQLRALGDTDHHQARVFHSSDPDVTIRWHHLEASLLTTRNSISVIERGKLANIYREFIVGRNGEMPSGQGPMEVGARSSLM